ncbi:helix-turn-helix domain-containing protein [Sandaracinobacteroides hominis]|uniref:helix-turn-helix domain-containing protein n=1 Tax=Sandaracinobacteroides hominis TaxID=2780086 RepID=UPI0018F4CFA3|nr:helix-turn-helix transcriptional regulator [Sandaracinobacteroides hominis]
MAQDSRYIGPRLRRLRRDLGLTQANMATDLDISPSYVALLERNQRPLTADLLIRLAQTYQLDIARLAGDGGAEQQSRLDSVLKDPIFADIDLPPMEAADVAANYPAFTEALLRLHTAWREEQLALADRSAEGEGSGRSGSEPPDPVAESRRFLAARRNCFPPLDDAAERMAATIAQAEGLRGYLRARHGLKVRRLPSDVMMGAIRRLNHHGREVQLDDQLDNASQSFQLALQLTYLELKSDIDAQLRDGQFETENGRRLTHRALASYAAAAILMPYTAFARAADQRHYDVEALGRQFGASFEQAAHRLTTLQKPGHARVPFFFLRVDQAGNVSKRLDGAGFPFARHGGGCPLWSVHQVFRTPRQIVAQWIELPDGQRFFSVARTVTQGIGGFGTPRAERAIALVCAEEHAARLIYARAIPGPEAATPIGISCRLCHRADCTSRAAPPIGRDMLPDDYRRTSAPFGFSDG